MISNRSNAHISRSSNHLPLQTFGVSALALSLAAAWVGCGGSTTQANSGGHGEDAGVTTGEDSGAITIPVDSGTPTMAIDSGATIVKDAGPDANNGAPSSTYPAFPVDVAQVANQGGSVLKAPVVVTVTWSSDPDAATYNTFGDTIGATPYWSTIVGEYGVGPLTSVAADHVSITTAAPTGFSDADLDALVEAHAGVDWPAPTANTIYAIYMPPGAALYFGGSPDAGGQDACQQGVGGYHTSSQHKNYIYAIMPHCSGFATADVEISASHELDEAVTDPLPNQGTTAYQGFDNNHLAFEFMNQFQDELGDACESFLESTDTTDFTPYTVQRMWSNKSAAAGSHWCVPAVPEPYYNTTFLASGSLDDISVNLSPIYPGAGMAKSKGFKMALNTTRTIPIGFFSDKATSGPFTIDLQGLIDPQTGMAAPIAQDQNGNAINNGAATITLDKTSGVNGEIANITVKPTAYSSLGVLYFRVRAVLPGAKEHGYLPVLISLN